MPHNGTATEARSCGCTITSWYAQGEHIDSHVDACAEHDYCRWCYAAAPYGVCSGGCPESSATACGHEFAGTSCTRELGHDGRHSDTLRAAL